MKSRLVLAFGLLAVGLADVPTAWPQDVKAFDVHELIAMDRIGDPQVSPAGDRVVYVLSSLDREANRRRSDLWMVRSDGTGLRQLTTHEASDFNPRWSADGAVVWFLSTRSGSSQVWRLRVDGGEPEQVTDLPLSVGNLITSPDGSRLAFSLEVFPDCSTIECTKARLDEREERQESGQLYEGIFVRHWDTWKDGRRSHVFVMRAGGGEPRDVMQGLDADCPSKPFGGSEEFTFTPDGRSIVFTARLAGREEPWSTDFDLYVVPVDGSAAPGLITLDNRAWDTGPVFSPDGSTLAYLAMARPGYEADRFRVVLKPWPDGEARVLTEDWDRSPGSLSWSPDGQTILATAGNLGNVSLFAIDVEDGDARVLVEEGHVRSPAFAGERIVFGRDHLRSPVELYSAKRDGSDSRAITRVNYERLARLKLGQPEHFTFQGWNDEIVYAWLVKPIDFDPGRKYPIAFLIHGGPQGSFGNDFHYRWNPQSYAAAGYAAIMIDFHGSTGYGQEFSDAIRYDWGGKPLEDLQKGLAAALEKYEWLDGERVCALGASYGGYMVNWIAGNWPDGFRCLVNHDGVFDQRMMYFATEELWFPEWEQGGTYWANPEGFEKQNPARFVANWRTPMLVIHGAQDFRVPLEQGLGAFTVLQRQGIASQFLYFPDENHWVLSPANSVLWHETVLAWLDRWLKQPPPPPTQ
ncbi:MAG: S9 family peptidase [Gemmatimonadota bacterium]|nr:MAG: S9 family peptidase [Gemmatimonadota bacterium]